MMNMEELRTFLGWCTLINVGMYLLWFILFVFAHDWMHRFHGKWYRLSVEQFDAIHYRSMASYKTMIMVFNLFPWIALWIMQAG